MFVGGLALDGLASALQSGADIVCVDLEDAVPPARKAEARASVTLAANSLQAPAHVHLIARINSLRSLDGLADLQAMLLQPNAFEGLLLPKVETADEIVWAATLMTEAGSSLELYAIIETVQGLDNVMSIANADPRLRALFFGGFDLSTALGCTMAWEPLLYARSRVVHAAASAQLDAIDSPYPDIDDLNGLHASCEQAKALGMTGKSAKHASQIATIRAVFTPTAEEIAAARQIIALYDADPTRPLVHQGKLIELPAIRRYQRMSNLAIGT